MMRMRGLMVASLLLVLLVGGLWWSNRTKEAEAKKLPADTTPKLLSIPEDQVSRIEIRKGGDDTILQKDKSGTWELTAPKPLPTDTDAVNSMLSTVSSLSSDRLVEDKAADLTPYGLAKPGVEVTVTKKDGKSQELLIGDETPTSSGYFAKLAGDPRVFTIASYNKTSLDKTYQDLRDKRLLPFNSDKLTRVDLLAKGQDIEFGKNNQNDWAILKPKPLRADGGQVDDLVDKLKNAKMDTSVPSEDAKKAAAAFAGGTQVAVAKVTDANGTEQLIVRKDKDKNYYARSTAVEGVYKIGSDVGDALDKGLNDFRNKKLFDFGWNDPNKIEAHDGAKQYAWQKTGDKWTAGSTQMDSTSMQTLIDKLRDLQATKFPDQGYTTPSLELTVTSNGGKRVEKVGLAKDGTNWIAKREGEPSLYQLDANVVSELQKALAGVKPAVAAAKKK